MIIANTLFTIGILAFIFAMYNLIRAFPLIKEQEKHVKKQEKIYDEQNEILKKLIANNLKIAELEKQQRNRDSKKQF